MMYIAVILISVISVGFFDGMQGGFSLNSLLDGMFSASVCAMAVFLIDALSAFLIRRLPTSWFSCERSLFGASKNERRFYRYIKINSWKDLVPELGGFTSFHKDRLESVSDREYLARFILESNYGVIIHFANAVLGIFIFLLPHVARPNIWIPIFFVNFMLSILPMMILRYHLPVLERLYRRAIEK